jgi:prepilin-type N-terminal cleavage/methylation domain-containing protein
MDQKKISRFKKSKTDEKPSIRIHGFTLIELVVTLLIVSIFATIVGVRMTTSQSVLQRSAARKIAGTIRLTYSMAAINKKPYRICFDLELQKYWIEEKKGKNYVRVDDDMFNEIVIPEPILLSKIKVMDRECSSLCQEYLYFTPGGYVEEAAFHIADSEGFDARVISIFTRPMTGRAVIVMEELTREDWEEDEKYGR